MSDLVDKYINMADQQPDDDLVSRYIKMADDQAAPEPQPDQSQPADVPTDYNLANRDVNPENDYSVLEKVLGAGEAARAVGSGMTTGMASQLVGTIQGFANAMMDKIKTGKWNPETVQKKAEEYAAAGTYQPKSPAGKEYLGNIADSEAMRALESMGPVYANEMAAMSAAKRVPIEKPPKEVGLQIRAAAKTPDKVNKATMQMADTADLSPAAIQAEKNLGMDLPASFLSENQQTKQTASLARSKYASEAASQHVHALEQARQKIDHAMHKIGAKDDISTVSDKVFKSLDTEREKLKQNSRKIYDKIDESIPETTPANIDNISLKVREIVKNNGGIEGLDSDVKRLYAMTESEKPVTFGRLLNEKNKIGQALGKDMVKNAYPTTDRVKLGGLYDAIREDHRSTVRINKGEGAVEELKAADEMTIAKKDLEKKIVAIYDKDKNGSITRSIKTALNTGAEGDIKNLNKVISSVPKDMLKEVIVTGIDTLSRNKGTREFSFAKYASFYKGLRDQKAVYKAIAKAIKDPKALQVLGDLYRVSKRIKEAETIYTGKSLQNLEHTVTAESMVEKIAGSTAGKGVAAFIGFHAGGGPVGSAVGLWLSNFIANTKPDRMAAAGKLLNSEEFKRLAVQAALGKETKGAANSVVKTRAFKTWLNKIGRPAAIAKNPALWLIGSVQTKEQEN